jgi:hypothetical protein
MQSFPGINTVYVDKGHAVASRNGSIFKPFNKVADGIEDVVSGAAVSIVTGYYSETMTIAKPMTLIAPVGAVIIGK